jgi:hypothetical protein
MTTTQCKRGHPWIPENIYVRPSGKKQCKICMKIWREKNQIRILLRSKQWAKDNPERIKEIQHKHRNTDEFRKRHAKEMRTYLKKYIPQLQREVLTHYGNGKLACVCCDQEGLLFLTIDHMNGRKQYEKKNHKYRGWMLKMYLRKHNYPKGYQTLCWNCNGARSLNGGVCPHKTNQSQY